MSSLPIVAWIGETPEQLFSSCGIGFLMGEHWLDEKSLPQVHSPCWKYSILTQSSKNIVTAKTSTES